MSVQVTEALTAVVERLLAVLERDAQLKAEVRELARAVLDLTAEDESNDEPVTSDAREEATESESSADDDDDESELERPPASELVKRLRWSSGPGTVPLPPQPKPSAAALPPRPKPPAAASALSADTSELTVIERRCRLKAEGLKWLLERQRLIRRGVDFRNEIEPFDSDLISRAKELPDCFLWMNHPTGPTPLDPDAWEDAAGCFETLADALSLARQAADDVDLHADVFENCLDLMAESQSALRVAVARIDGPRDVDQRDAFNWLRDASAERQIFIRNFMRSSESAEPTEWEDLATRIERLDNEFLQARQASKLLRKRIKKVAYLAKQIRTGPEEPDFQHWRTLCDTVEELIADDLPPSNRELREQLLPIIDELPEACEPGDGMRLVLREIDRYLANQSSDDGDSASTDEPTREVRRVAAALAGKVMVLIGGQRRPHAQSALRDAFGLGDLVWVSTKEHESTAVFEPQVAKPDVAVVLLAVRWSSHSYGDVKQFCDQHGKYFVRLKAGYNPNQVAAHVLDQCPSLFGAD